MTSANWIVEITLLGLLLLSIATWSIAAIKFRGFRADGRASKAFLEGYWSERSWTQRSVLARNSCGSFAQLAQAGYATCKELAGDEGEGCDAQELQEILERQLRKEIQRMNRHRERGLAELASIGSTAPFIGLFGTVWGIMNALKTITATG